MNEERNEVRDVETQGNAGGTSVGSLMYLTAIRPDLLFVVSVIRIFMEKLVEAHLIVAK